MQNLSQGINFVAIMKVLMLFLVSLCFLLLRSGEYAHYRKHHDHSVYAPAQDVKKTLDQKFASVDPGARVIKNATAASQKHEVFSAEEDEDFVFSRKYVLLASFFFTLAYAIVLSDFFSRFKNRLPFNGHFAVACTGIFLVLRSIRI
ncbi:hypothetical protein [Pedobacter sp. SYP-B3415]|uniref:hypothetical protein n=1 Tax=Pedobacter sp. SYP-B3415 TaxID=2496641 RepID=UPI00101CDA59|nr:hypothetical protein [Pedobacter sp. SYP-B3415]